MGVQTGGHTFMCMHVVSIYGLFMRHVWPAGRGEGRGEGRGDRSERPFGGRGEHIL